MYEPFIPLPVILFFAFYLPQWMPLFISLYSDATEIIQSSLFAHIFSLNVTSQVSGEG